MCYVYVCVCVCVCVHTHMLCAMYLYVCAHMHHNMFKVNSPHSRFLFVNCMLVCARAFVHMDLSASVESLLANSWSVQSNRCRLWGKRVRCLLVLISLPTARHVLKACINTRECTHAYTFAFKHKPHSSLADTGQHQGKWRELKVLKSLLLISIVAPVCVQTCIWFWMCMLHKFGQGASQEGRAGRRFYSSHHNVHYRYHRRGWLWPCLLDEVCAFISYLSTKKERKISRARRLNNESTYNKYTHSVESLI